MSNIIDFNAMKLKKMEERFDELTEQSEIIEDLAADFAISAVMDIIDACYEFGFDVMENPDVIRDLLLTLEGIRGIIHRINADRLAVHDISDSMFNDITDTKSALEQFLKEFSE